MQKLASVWADGLCRSWHYRNVQWSPPHGLCFLQPRWPHLGSPRWTIIGYPYRLQRLLCRSVACASCSPMSLTSGVLLVALVWISHSLAKASWESLTSTVSSLLTLSPVTNCHSHVAVPVCPLGTTRQSLDFNLTVLWVIRSAIRWILWRTPLASVECHSWPAIFWQPSLMGCWRHRLKAPTAGQRCSHDSHWWWWWIRWQWREIWNTRHAWINRPQPVGRLSRKWTLDCCLRISWQFARLCANWPHGNHGEHGTLLNDQLARRRDGNGLYQHPWPSPAGPAIRRSRCYLSLGWSGGVTPLLWRQHSPLQRNWQPLRRLRSHHYSNTPYRPRALICFAWLYWWPCLPRWERRHLVGRYSTSSYWSGTYWCTACVTLALTIVICTGHTMYHMVRLHRSRLWGKWTMELPLWLGVGGSAQRSLPIMYRILPRQDSVCTYTCSCWRPSKWTSWQRG